MPAQLENGAVFQKGQQSGDGCMSQGIKTAGVLLDAQICEVFGEAARKILFGAVVVG